ncbi:MAG: ribonuclease D [Myxococcales bacterium]|nr:ribonuclease D [Myxococcales bacterium]
MSSNLSSAQETEIIRDTTAIAGIGERLAASKRFGIDLEFMSADRYIPDLALVQLVWEENGDLQMVLIDGVDTELAPIFTQIESTSVLTLAHGAKQDLSLLGFRYQVKAGAFMDTQIAAAFAGVAEQIGYGNLVDRLLGTKLDKGPQFTDWLRRPLSPKQLRYALDDVRYLLPAWDALRIKLDQAERRPWAQEESDGMASAAATRRPPELAYLGVGGSGSLKGAGLGALRALAAWRDDIAVSDNIPPGWILADPAAVDICRRNVRNERDLKKVRGIGSATVSKYGPAILRIAAEGRNKPVEGGARNQLDPVWQAQAAVITAMVAGRATEVGLPLRTIAAKADAEALVRHALGQLDAEECKLMRGWRAEVMGLDALAWLRGEASVFADPKLGVRIQKP